MICYLDFDRTINKGHINSSILELNEGVKEFVMKIKSLDYKVILNTYRTDLNNGSMEIAINFLNKNEIKIDDIVPNKVEPTHFDLSAAVLFIDDELSGIPLKKSDKEHGVSIVDFKIINNQLCELYGI